MGSRMKKVHLRGIVDAAGSIRTGAACGREGFAVSPWNFDSLSRLNPETLCGDCLRRHFETGVSWFPTP